MNVKTLMALRTQLDAAQIVIDGLIEEALSGPVKHEPVGCPHDGAINISTCGNIGRFYCKVCRTEYTNHSDGAVLTGANEGGNNHG